MKTKQIPSCYIRGRSNGARLADRLLVPRRQLFQRLLVPMVHNDPMPALHESAHDMAPEGFIFAIIVYRVCLVGSVYDLGMLPERSMLTSITASHVACASTGGGTSLGAPAGKRFVNGYFSSLRFRARVERQMAFSDVRVPPLARISPLIEDIGPCHIFRSRRTISATA